MSRRSVASRAQSTTSAGAPGSRSKATTVGTSGASAMASDGCSSRLARLATHTSDASPSTTQYGIVPGARSIQSGACGGQRFS